MSDAQCVIFGVLAFSGGAMAATVGIHYLIKYIRGY